VSSKTNTSTVTSSQSGVEQCPFQRRKSSSHAVIIVGFGTAAFIGGAFAPHPREAASAMVQLLSTPVALALVAVTGFPLVKPLPKSMRTVVLAILRAIGEREEQQSGMP
jgi:hypothetical protein